MKSLMIISLVLVVLTVGALAVRYGGGFKLAAAPPPAGELPAEGQGLGDVGPVVKLDPFVVSSAESSEQHMSTVTFEVEVADAEARDAIKARSSAVRSAILNVLADTKLNDIGDPEDFAALKNKVQRRLQSVLPEHIVRRVLITEFLSL
jgi:flagellar basal body-associated protein FliL